MDRIELKDKVEDNITGFTGVVIAICHYLSERTLCEVLPVPDPVSKNKMMNSEWINEERLTKV